MENRSKSVKEGVARERDDWKLKQQEGLKRSDNGKRESTQPLLDIYYKISPFESDIMDKNFVSFLLFGEHKQPHIKIVKLIY